jgi:hypothetical protein
LLQQEFPAAIENQQRKGPVQYAAALMTLSFAHMSDFAIRLIHQDERL